MHAKLRRLGYATLCTGDHPSLGGLAPLTAFLVAAEATTSLRFASHVLNNDLRHPGMLADLGDQLVDRYSAHALDGWRSVAVAGMALAMDHLPEHIASPPDVTVERVTTVGALDEWVAVAESHR